MKIQCLLLLTFEVALAVSSYDLINNQHFSLNEYFSSRGLRIWNSKYWPFTFGLKFGRNARVNDKFTSVTTFLRQLNSAARYSTSNMVKRLLSDEEELFISLICGPICLHGK